MRVARSRVVCWLVGGLAAMSLAGCAIVTDLFDPGLFPGQTSPGVVIVALYNTTSFTAELRAFESADSVDLSRDSRNFSAEVAAGQVASEVLECPVEMIGPGSLGTDYSFDGTAAIVTTGTGQVAVTYTGPPLTTPAYRCGDVVEIRLSQTAAAVDADDEEAFRITVRVIPG